MKNIMKFLLLGIFMFQPYQIIASEEIPTMRMQVLASFVANKIVTSAVEECTGRGYLVTASVVDRNGNLVALLRHPLSGTHTIKVSQRKAFSSATLRAKTSEIALRRSDLNFAPGILLIVGGIPIQFNGNFYGGVGVAGAPPEIDELCAQAGIDAISDIMEFAD